MATWAWQFVPLLLAAAAGSCGAEVGPGWTWSKAPESPPDILEESILFDPEDPGQENPFAEDAEGRICCELVCVEVIEDEAPVVEPPPAPAPEPVVEDEPRGWLSRHQAPDGSWSAEGVATCGRRPCEKTGDPGRTTGRTGLALLAYVGWGETHRSPRNGTVVRGGLKYLKSIQDEEGCFGSRDAPGFPQDHALATLAMAEIYGLTISPLFKNSAQKGVEFLQSIRTPGGGWRSLPWARADDPILTAWATAALRSARAGELVVDEEAFRGALDFVDRITDPGTGRAGSSEASAAVLWIRKLCGQGLDHPTFLLAAGDLLEHRPRKDEEPGPRLLGWFLGTTVMYNLGRTGRHTREGEWWKTWSAELDPALETCVRGVDAGCAMGSVDPLPGEFGRAYGRVGATAIHALVRVVFYR